MQYCTCAHIVVMIIKQKQVAHRVHNPFRSVGESFLFILFPDRLTLLSQFCHGHESEQKASKRQLTASTREDTTSCKKSEEPMRKGKDPEYVQPIIIYVLACVTSSHAQKPCK